MALSKREERDLGLRVDRNSLAPPAREPEEDATGLGFGGYYAGPLEERPDVPLLGDAEVGEEEEGCLSPEQSGLPERADLCEEELTPHAARPAAPLGE